MSYVTIIQLLIKVRGGGGGGCWLQTGLAPTLPPLVPNGFATSHLLSQVCVSPSNCL